MVPPEFSVVFVSENEFIHIVGIPWAAFGQYFGIPGSFTVFHIWGSRDTFGSVVDRVNIKIYSDRS